MWSLPQFKPKEKEYNDTQALREMKKKHQQLEREWVWALANDAAETALALEKEEADLRHKIESRQNDVESERERERECAAQVKILSDKIEEQSHLTKSLTGANASAAKAALAAAQKNVKMSESRAKMISDDIKVELAKIKKYATPCPSQSSHSRHKKGHSFP